MFKIIPFRLPRFTFWAVASLLAMLLSIAAAGPAHSNNWLLTQTHQFSDVAVGNTPPGELLLATDGNFYGSTIAYSDPDNRAATIWKISPSGVLTVIHTCTRSEGVPNAALVQGSDGSFYGTASNSTSTNLELAFKVTPSGVFTVLHTFTLANGFTPTSYGGPLLRGARLIQASDGNFYGTTQYGGPSYVDNNHPGYGTVFKMTPAGVVTVLHAFTGTDGANPTAPLIQGTDGNVYGAADYGGTGFTGTTMGSDGVPSFTGQGVLFKVTMAGTYTLLHAFTGPDGERPHADLIQTADGNFAGVTELGGAFHDGTIFSMTPAGAVTTITSRHNIDGEFPVGRMVQASDGNFYGAMTQSGDFGFGTVYQVTPGGIMTRIHSFTVNDGSEPVGLTLGPDGTIYGMSISVAFRLWTSSAPPAASSMAISPTFASVVPSGYQKFTATVYDQYGQPLAAQPTVTWTVSGGGTIDGGLFAAGATPGGGYTVTAASGALNATAATLVMGSASGPTLTSIYDFNIVQAGSNERSRGPLVRGGDGAFYNTKVMAGGELDESMVYRITPSGAFTPLYHFVRDSWFGGAPPRSGLTLAPSGDFYGVTYNTNNGGDALFYKITTGGILTPLHIFQPNTGQDLLDSITLGADGNFYGDGYDLSISTGGIDRLTPSGSVSLVDPFVQIFEGPSLPSGPLAEDSSGNFFGASFYGGDSMAVDYQGYGTVVKITPDGKYTALHSFDGTDAYKPTTGVLLANDGNLYGVSKIGGPDTAYMPGQRMGTIYKASPAGGFAVLHAFSGPDGSSPCAPLIQASNGYLYGVTDSGYDGNFGAFPGYGSIFKISASGAFTSLYQFDATSGYDPEAPVTEGVDGNFYGTTNLGGVHGSGTVFRLNTGPKTVTSIFLSPAHAAIRAATTFTFTVIPIDQNGQSMSAQLPITWSVSGGGTIDSHGVFSAGIVSGGPFTVTAVTGGFTSTSTIMITPSPVTSDFNGDGKPDLILQNDGTRQAALWYLNGASVTGGAYVSTAPPAGWRIAAVGDFNGDGKPDLVLNNSLANQVAIWYMNGATVLSMQTIAPATPGDVVAAFDVNGDGKTDIVFQNPQNGRISYWVMDGITKVQQVLVTNAPPSGWKVRAHGDFNRDNLDDLVLQNVVTGQVAFWYMSKGIVIGGAYLATTPPAGWSVDGVGDYNADARPDLVLQNASTNIVALWYVNGTKVIGGQYLSSTPPAKWTVVGPR